MLAPNEFVQLRKILEKPSLPSFRLLSNGFENRSQLFFRIGFLSCGCSHPQISCSNHCSVGTTLSLMVSLMPRCFFLQPIATVFNKRPWWGYNQMKLWALTAFEGRGWLSPPTGCPCRVIPPCGRPIPPSIGFGPGSSLIGSWIGGELLL